VNRGNRWGEFVSETPEPEPDFSDPGPLGEAHEIVDAIQDEIDNAREHIHLVETMLDDLRDLLDSGDLRENGSRPEDDA